MDIIDNFLLYAFSDVKKAEDCFKRAYNSSKKHSFEECADEAFQKVKEKWGLANTEQARDNLIKKGALKVW